MWSKSKIESAKAKRSYPRALVEAVARLSNDSRNLTCVVEDISASGARLRLDNDAAQYMFGDGWALTSAMFGNLPIEIRWRNVDHAGITFNLSIDERAHLNRFIKTLIRHGVTEAGFYAADEEQTKTVPPTSVRPGIHPRRVAPNGPAGSGSGIDDAVQATVPPSVFRRNS